jgi:hypothetical protein
MEQVAVRLEEDPEYRDALVEVRRQLAPLRAWERAAGDCRPPAGLAERTTEFVFAQAAQRRPAGTTLRAVPTLRGVPAEQMVPSLRARPFVQAVSPEAQLSPCPAAPGRASRIRWIDAIAVAAVVILISAAVWPALDASRLRARLSTCQDNLRELGVALTSYSRNHDERFPAVPTEGRLAAAGVYAPLLVSDGYLSDSRRVLCPESPLAGCRDFQIPSVEEFQSVGQEEAARLRRQMGGSYGYCIGHLECGRLVPTKNLGRSYFAVMSDAPSDVLPDHQSLNHGGRGQNVLLEDGHVAFITGSQIAADDIFANDNHQVAAGIHADDSVIAGSGTAPILQVNYR